MSTPRVASGDEPEIRPFIRVRHATAEKIEDRLASSKPLLISSLIFNLAFVVAPFSVLVLSRHEKAPVLRCWTVGYALQVLLHMFCIFMKYRNRHRHLPAEGGGGGENPGGFDLESLKVFDKQTWLMWWIIGLIYLSNSKHNLRSRADAPQLYWLFVVLLGIDIFLIVVWFCVFMVALSFCLPCIIAILHAVVDDEEGAKDEDIQRLRNFRFRLQDRIMRECNTDFPVEYLIPASDAGCSICLDAYHDGAELRELPCRHHFHSVCVDKWLHVSATCPLCKLGIGNRNDGDQEMRECVIPVEDAECCICLNSYDDGAEVRELPCRHQFHTACVDKWLHINATCPLCKFNVGNQIGGDDQV